MAKSLIQLPVPCAVFRKELRGTLDTIESVVSEKIDHEKRWHYLCRDNQDNVPCGNNPRIMVGKGDSSGCQGQVASPDNGDPKALMPRLVDIQRLYIAGLMVRMMRFTKGPKVLQDSRTVHRGMETILTEELIKMEM